MPATRRTVRLCYFSMLVVALVVNLAPPLFIPLRTAFGLSFEQLGRFILLNFMTQVCCVLVCGPLVDRLGARPFALLANGFVFAGVWLFALADRIFPAHPYTGLLLGTLVFSMGGGTLDLLLSPIVNATPSDRKAADMSLLHAFYAVGQILAVLLTSLAIWFGAPWRAAVLCWSLLPLTAMCGFAAVRIPPFVTAERRQRLRGLIRKPLFLAALAGIFLAGASELAVAQWVSAYAEKGLGLPKLLGDLGGPCLFAAMLGAGRLWMGLRSGQTHLERVLPASCAVTIVAYLVACLAPWPWLALAACAIAGLGISLLWPGMLVAAAQRFPRGGASMFAMLSACGALGGALVPWAVGLVADGIAMHPGTPDLLARAGVTLAPEAFGLRAGMLAAVLCPVLMLVLVRWIGRQPPDANAV